MASVQFFCQWIWLLWPWLLALNLQIHHFFPKQPKTIPNAQTFDFFVLTLVPILVYHWAWAVNHTSRFVFTICLRCPDSLRSLRKGHHRVRHQEGVRRPSRCWMDWVLLGPGSQESSISNKKAYKAKLEKVSGAEWAGWWWKFGKLCCFGGSNPCFPINFPLSQWVEGHFFEGICLTERGLELAWDLGSKMAVRAASPDGNSWQTWFLLIFAHAFVTHFLDTLPILSWFWKEQGFQPKRTTGSVAVCYPPQSTNLPAGDPINFTFELRHFCW